MNRAEDLLDDTVDDLLQHAGRPEGVGHRGDEAASSAGCSASTAATSRLSGSTPASRSTRFATQLWDRVEKRYTDKEQLVEAELLRRVERDIMLQIVDVQWKDHLYSLDHLKDGIGLRGYGQRDPLVEYKKESYALFQDMNDRVSEEMVRYLWLLRPVAVGGGAAAQADAGAARRAGHAERRRRRRLGVQLGAGRARDARADRRRRRRSRRCDATSRRSAGTTRARAGAARSTRSATGPVSRNGSRQG